MLARSIGGALAILGIVASSAFASPAKLIVVVRGGDDDLAVERLRGQVADLEVQLAPVAGPLEPALDAQLATAARLAGDAHARVVVWFVARAGGGGAVAIAMPEEHRLFVRELPHADPSALAEAEAVAARGALQAIAAGGTIGITVEPAPEPPPEPVAVPVPPAASEPHLAIEAALGWQVALDDGADRGAQAVAQRTTLARGPWAGSLALALGVPGTRAGTTEVELARSSGAAGIERRFGSFAVALSLGAVLYRRSTVATPSDLAATRATTTVAFVAGPELRYRWQPGHSPIGIELTAGLDVVAGAPELAVMRGTEIDSLGRLWSAQPRVMVGLFARSHEP